MIKKKKTETAGEKQDGKQNIQEKPKNEGEKEEYLYHVTGKKGSRAEMEAVAPPGSKVSYSGLQRPRLTFLFMRKNEREVIHGMYPDDFGGIEETTKGKYGGK